MKSAPTHHAYIGSIGRSDVYLGRFTYGYEYIKIKQWNEGASLTIGSFCSIASNITIFLGGNHRTDWITTFPFGHVFNEELGSYSISGHPATKGDVLIGHDVWIGEGTTIMSGITIGDGAVIAANSTVVNDVAAYHIVGGNPAVIIKKRFNQSTIDLLLKLQWWNMPLSKIREIAPLLCSKPDNDLITELINRDHVIK